MTKAVPRVLVTAGEPAGIGPDLTAQIAVRSWPAELIACGDPDLIARRAALLDLDVAVEALDELPATRQPHRAGTLRVWATRVDVPVVAGALAPRNASYVLESLRRATSACLAGRADALVTGPVHKGVINDAGHAFTGHTEFLAALTDTAQPVMLLCAGRLRVALATTHIPLRSVPDAIDAGRLESVIEVLHADLRRRFGIAEPRIAVCGLNPHAGEGGHLGREEIDVIAPLVAELKARGVDLRGPLPADTAFTPQAIESVDAVLAMYHDQGLPVVKHSGFGSAVNVTLGLPIIRTSVDHGTALDLAGTGKADPGSLIAAIDMAIELTRPGADPS